MTTWTDVINYVRTRYEVLEESEGWLRFRLDADGDRTQQVSVHHVPDADGLEWLEISSPVGWADKIDLRRFLELAGTCLVGAAAVVDGVALLKHAVPLTEHSVMTAFTRPLEIVVAQADAFEGELTDADHF